MSFEMDLFDEVRSGSEEIGQRQAEVVEILLRMRMRNTYLRAFVDSLRAERQGVDVQYTYTSPRVTAPDAPYTIAAGKVTRKT